MASFSLGPIDLNLLKLESGGLTKELMQVLAGQVQSGLLRLVDMVSITRELDDSISVTEVDLSVFGIEGLEVVASGIIAIEDLELLAAEIPPGGSAILVALELVWAIDLANALAQAGGEVVATERIPASAVNAVLESALE